MEKTQNWPAVSIANREPRARIRTGYWCGADALFWALPVLVLVLRCGVGARRRDAALRTRSKLLYSVGGCLISIFSYRGRGGGDPVSSLRGLSSLPLEGNLFLHRLTGGHKADCVLGMRGTMLVLVLTAFSDKQRFKV